MVILDVAGAERRLSHVFEDPAGLVVARAPAEVATALTALREARSRGLHAAGYFSYELGYALESKLMELMPAERGLPLLWFGLFRSRRELDDAGLDALIAKTARGRAYAGPLRFAETRELYRRKFARVQDYIRAGDVYQVNLTFPAHFAFVGDPLALYSRLRRTAQAGHGGYIDDGERALLSFSPELFFRIEAGEIVSRPMKGTAPRGADADEDERLRATLGESAKERAENLMIVDLIRNDLGRIARTGSVRVDELFKVETYPTVHQMVSTIRADLTAHAAPSDIVRALFPCGSVTGAPKIRAMEIIRELEDEPRGVYCGAIGSFAPDGAAAFNVAIRTLTIQGNQGTLGIGGGLVADSTADAEYDECLLKARFFSEGRPPLSLIETLRLDHATGFLRGALHLERLEHSARVLGLPFDLAKINDALTATTSQGSLPSPLEGEGGAKRRKGGASGEKTRASRVRILLGEDGTVDVATQNFTPQPPDAVWRYAISDHRVASGDLLLQHKTTWRTLNDDERKHWNARGCDEVVFLNECGEIVEASLSNIFAKIGGRLLTPPLSSGALPGCLRRDLIERGECHEAVLTPSDLQSAETVYLGNSLRGLIRAAPFGDSQ